MSAAGANPDDDTDDASPQGAAADNTEEPETDGGAEDQGDDQGTVLCTIMSMPDGSFQLLSGDEDDGDESDETGDMQTDGEEPSKPEPQTFDAPGPLLAAVLKLVKANSSDGDAAFNEGYEGSAEPTPKGGE